MSTVKTPRANTSVPLGELRFSAAHREQFKELLKIGEVYAINLQPEHLPFGLWGLECDLREDEKADRLKSRFGAAVRKAAMAAGAPPRANLLDWWISKLARDNSLYLRGLIQRSIELCEGSEADSADIPWKMQLPAAMTGFRRDQYPTNFEVPYWLYDVPHDTLSDPQAEFAYWKDHVWQGFWKLFEELKKNGVVWTDRSIHDARKRQSGETRLGFRRRIASRVSTRYERLQSALLCLGFDLAVLLANYVIDRGFTGSDAIGLFDAECVQLAEEMRACWKDTSRQLGLSWSKQLEEGKHRFEIAKPFCLVKDDLALLVGSLSNRRPAFDSEPGTASGAAKAAGAGAKHSLQARMALNESDSAGLGSGTDENLRDAKPPLNVKLIEAWMADEGWTNKTLAPKLKISERAVSSIRNNGNYHGADAVTKLANLMGRDREDLYLPPEASI